MSLSRGGWIPTDSTAGILLVVVIGFLSMTLVLVDQASAQGTAPGVSWIRPHGSKSADLPLAPGL